MSQQGFESKNRYFRSLGQLEGTPEFEQFLSREFPQAASEFPEGVSRRRWIQLMGASLALGGAAGCRYNREEFAAFVVRPEGRIAGVPEHFATNFEWAGRAVHLLVTNMDGRPIKLDGNPQFPSNAAVEPADFKDGKEQKFASAGCDVYTQGAVLSLYDPDRLSAVLKSGESAGAGDGWVEFESYVKDSVGAWESSKGKGLAIVFEPTRSPSLQRKLAEVKAKLPEATLVAYDPVNNGNLSKAIAAVGAGKSQLVYRLDLAKIIVAVDADLLGSDPSAMLHARQFATGRTPTDGGEMNRLYVIESQYSVTGGAADYRLAVKPSGLANFLAKLEVAVDALKAGNAATVTGDTPYYELDSATRVTRAIEVIAGDLVRHAGASLLAVGSQHSVEIQQAALRINAKLGNIGKALQLFEVPSLLNEEVIGLGSFVESAAGGKFSSAWILGTNPVFSASGGLKVADALSKVGNVVYLSDYADETSAVSAWTLPVTHPLESWGDVRGVDGTYGVCQPQIEPLLNGRDPLSVLSMLAGLPPVDSQEFVMETAQRVAGVSLNKRQWKELLHSGYLANSQAKLSSAPISMEGSLPGGEVDLDGIEQGKIDVQFFPGESVYDGRLANNGWLQELPQPITKLTWDNAILVSPRTAKKLQLAQGELASISVGGNSLRLPVFYVVGHAEGAVTIHYGYGRTKSGVVGTGVGHDVNALRPSSGESMVSGAEIRGTTQPYRLSTTQDHFAIDDLGMREIAKRSPSLIREGTLKQYLSDQKFAYETYRPHHENVSMWREPIDKIEVEQPFLPQWGMSIDLNKCVGCNACVIACQSENNVPVVGKDQVARGREMHWLRLDRYFQCDFEANEDAKDFSMPIDPVVVHQPLACVHCETAPCEQVCPVAATVHTEEGINAMAYNRCIGTRYCANNCPYKVRRFNYFNYNKQYGYFYGWQDWREKVNTKLQSLVLNPEVSVRGRGVMEKCTYCIQRVQNGKIKSRQTGDGKIHDGDIKTACQEACPTQAIVFGDLTDKQSRVYRQQSDPRRYDLLEELNVKPRTVYLARLRNVPELLMTRVQAHPKEIEAHHDEHSHDGDHSHEGEEHARGKVTGKSGTAVVKR